MLNAEMISAPLASALPAWSRHPFYGLVHPVPADADICDDVVVRALSSQGCECLNLVTPSAARVYERTNMARMGTARLVTLPEGNCVLTLEWRRF